MKRTRVMAGVVTLVLAAAACGGGKTTSDNTNAGGSSSTPATGGTTSTTSALAAKCKSAPLEASETGVTATEIHIGVMADTGSPLRPGLFQGSVDGVKAWAAWKNATEGGVGCRKVVVDAYDSKLSPDESRNGATKACSNDIALVGTTALFFQDMTALSNCKDKAGANTGLPDLPELQTTADQQCSQLSFATLPPGSSCPYSGSGPRTFKLATGIFEYYLKKYPGQLHGVWIIPQDLPSTISSSMPGFRESQKLGIKLDQEFGASGLYTQDKYAPFIQAIKSHKSTYVRNGLDYVGTVYTRKEAQLQGVNSVLVWDCSIQCYDQRLISQGGSAVENQYVWMTILPFEDKGSNPVLDGFLQYDSKPDGFGAQAFIAAEMFGESIDKIVTDQGPNAITRANLLTTVKNTHDFTAGGFIPPTDVGNKTGSKCFVLMQVQHGKFVRIDPTQPGTFDCSGGTDTLTIDPLKTFHG